MTKVRDDEIIKMLANEKRIIIDDNDPIMAQYYLNEILVSQFSENLKSSLIMTNDTQREQLDSLLSAVNKDIKGTLNKALFFSQKAMDEEFESRTNDMVSKLRKETDNYISHSHSQSKQLKNLTYINIIISFVMTLLMIIFVYNTS